MNRSRTSRGITGLGLLASWLFVAAVPLAAEVKLPHVIGDHMVLQRDVPLPVWGWADPGETVTVMVGGHEARTRADAKGHWMVKLPALEAGGPHEMTVSGENTIRLTDILVGEVWLCAGQSNMEMGIGVVQDGQQEVAAADYPQIRLYELPRNTAGQPAPDLEATWRVCSPATIAAGGWGGFSAVGYFFGRELHKELDVPVGLIDTTWGGTRIEPWTPPEGFALVPKLAEIADQIEQANRDYRNALPASLDAIDSWVKATRQALAEDQTLLPAPPAWPRHPLDNNGQPTGLYNGMVHPLVPFAIRGAIWYQGEANVHAVDGMMYYEKTKALIGGWRAVWDQGDFPFYFVQLAPFNYKRHIREMSDYALPEIWEAQAASLSIPNTGMAVITDIGNLNDIHPRNKLDVGKRLALWALAQTYGRDGIVYSGPLYRSMAVEDGKIRIQFDHVGGGLASRDGQPLNWFEIAGEDRQFVEAQAKIDGQTVIVWSDKVAEPVAVRFGWHQQAEPNLMNKEGLPACPFRTHPW
jgi:sialate O-acetylesterase